MKHLVSLKLKTQDIDLIAYQLEEQTHTITLEHPVQVKLDTNQGFYAVDWLYLANKKIITIDKRDIFYYTEPSDRAQSIYDEFWHSMSEQSMDDIKDELETIFESRLATKH